MLREGGGPRCVPDIGGGALVEYAGGPPLRWEYIEGGGGGAGPVDDPCPHAE